MMATYFNGGSEIQADNLQTLFLMNRGGYSDYPQPPPGVLLLNPAAPNNHLVGIPLAGDEISTVGSPAGVLQGQLVPRFHYNLWSGAGDHQTPAGEFRRPAPVTLAATSSTSTQGGLSLSLNNSSVVLTSPGSGTPTSASGVSPIVGSKFLKAAQLLLDEVVNVGKAIDNSKPVGSCKVEKVKAVSVGEASSSAAELSTAQRQELHMKKAKLLNMLDEVEQRYRQYNSQMQMVAASFEQAAGAGSAKSYTQLALQTISKQFRCLKDAIEMQIKGTGKSMGEGEEEDGEQGRSRLRMVDHQMRQQRAMQQLGMMHHNAWRPQRGLPERAVSVLRAWLFEHFLHPYPKDSDKHMLAKQTGLTRSQVSNWFINARVRLWKPMVEEMYVEEMKSHEQNNSETDHNKDMIANSPKPTPPLHTTHNHSFNQNPHQELLTPNNNDVVLSNNPTMTTMGPVMGPPRSPKRQRMMMNNSDVTPTINLPSMDKEMKPGGRELFPPNLTGFGSYPIGEIGSRFNPDHHQHHHQHQHQYQHGNAVSLTLGLPHDCDQQEGYNFEEMNDVQNRKRFAAQLLPDYVT